MEARSVTVVVRRVPYSLACLRIRTEVFVDEQRVPAELEEDGLDPKAVHWLAEVHDEPAGTARLRWVEPGVGKVERVAVRRPWRGRGVGAGLMDAIEAYARAEGAQRLVLAAQVPVVAFYAARGYRAQGPTFVEAGIDHRRMILPFPPANG
jgi:predicted GNAT family N-acyltransferase